MLCHLYVLKYNLWFPFNSPNNVLEENVYFYYSPIISVFSHGISPVPCLRYMCLFLGYLGGSVH